MFLWIIGLAAATIATALVAWRKRSDDNWRPVLPWILGTVTGTVVSVASYLWVFERVRCGDRGDFACMLNQNQGMLTFLALVVTAVSLWLAKLNRESDRRVQRRVARTRTNVALTSAADEVAHNLIHVKLAYDGNGDFREKPQLSFDDVRHLCDHEFRLTIHRDVLEAAQNMLRNAGQMEIHSENVEEYEDDLRSLVLHSIQLLATGTLYHWEAFEPVLGGPGYQDFRRLRERRKGTYAICFRTSDMPNGDIARLRSEDAPLLCWRDDAKPAGVYVLAQEPRTGDLIAAGHHPDH